MFKKALQWDGNQVRVHLRLVMLIVAASYLGLLAVALIYFSQEPHPQPTEPPLVVDPGAEQAGLAGREPAQVLSVNLPEVVDFGGAAPGSPVAGLDQANALTAGLLQPKLGELEADVAGTQKMLVLRVYFNDYPPTSRYTDAQVQGLLNNLNSFFQTTSYGKVSLQSQVSPLFRLSINREDYKDWKEGRFIKLVEDAAANTPSGLDWDNLDILSVLISFTKEGEGVQGIETNSCELKIGIVNPKPITVDCLIVGENPSEKDVTVWGVWAHEVGHALQQDGPLHPSNYNSRFELMDELLPGQTGVFEKQPEMGFPGWMPAAKYQTFTPLCAVGPIACEGVGGGDAYIWAMEYDPAGRPNAQAVKAYVTNNLYYLISVRRRVLGDELDTFWGNPPGIPDEGVLIERVSIGGDRLTNDCPDDPNPCRRWVVLQGKGGDRNVLWKQGDTYTNSADGINITVKEKIDEDNYLVRVAYNGAYQPDVMINPWTSPPGNTWETTDIWVDSPVNGYGAYRYGIWDDGTGNQVPRGNGDDPAIGQPNRLYVRVRNVGSLPASNVVVRLEITDPPGKGITGRIIGWKPLGAITSAQFPGLANIDPGQYTDVFMVWTPDFAISPAVLAAGLFQFHTCIRVKMDALPGETVFGNQDGDREQENLDYFQAVPPTSAPTQYDDVIWLRNDDPANPQFFSLGFDSGLPAEWELDINGGQYGVMLNPGELRPIPITITPKGQSAVGSAFGVDVFAWRGVTLVDSTKPEETHPENRLLGGVRVQAFVLAQPVLTCEAEKKSDFEIYVKGKLEGAAGYANPEFPFKVMIEGVDSQSSQKFLPDTLNVIDVAGDGSFGGNLNPSDLLLNADHAACFFAGTTQLASVSSGYVPIHETPVVGTFTVAGGATLDSPDGKVNLQFPKDAVSEDHTLTFTKYLAPSMPLAGWQTGVYHFTLTAQTLGGQMTTQFLKPYTLTVRYSDEELGQKGIVESTLNLTYWDGDEWMLALPCPGCSLDPVNNILTVVLDHFTPFSLISQAFKLFFPLIGR